jgi:hypothetical protein
MSLRKRSGKKKSYYKRCTTFNCRKEVSLKKLFFFENTHLNTQSLMRLIYLFVHDMQVQEGLKKELKIESNSTVVD